MEAADSTANSSKVIVQCHDPYSLFDKIVPKLQSRLPLRNLHWKAPNRPLRSIDQLHVSFIRNDSKSDTAVNARRHQIPGLRQTPFVKVFLVRCDDRENYKETCRKEVKQWLKGQGISQDGKTLMKGQERHDAYEYIILHVVLPGTAAAAQPKSSKHISVEASESTDSVNSKSKWTGKSSSTIHDKLRADFSSSSKAPFDRVAQVRITDPDGKQPNGLGPSEIEEQWQDLVEKLKTAILLSFDARVAQYEEDIRDREAQRQLPGWNFCTFFVLKEGLARGFENVGLIEDALTVYDELDAGLDVLVQDYASRDEPDPTSALLPFSTDLKPAIRRALENTNGENESSDLDSPSLDMQTIIEIERKNNPFDAVRDNYQQRILTNQVSVLDFHIYIFTRQLQLLFRQANLVPPAYGLQSSSSKASTTCQNLDIIAEICEKATSFISYASRALWRDYYAAWGGQEGQSDEELETQQLVIGALVLSWKWSAATQILADCNILVLLKDVLIDPLSIPDPPTNGSAPSQNGISSDKQPKVNEDLTLWAGELFSILRSVLKTMTTVDVSPAGERDSGQGLQSQTLRLLRAQPDTAFDIVKLLTIQSYQCFEAADRTNAAHSMLYALAKVEMENDNVDEAVWWLEHISDLGNLQARTATDRTLLRLYANCLKIQDRLDIYARVLINLLRSTVGNTFARRALPHYDELSQYALNEIIGAATSIAEIALPLTSFATIHTLPKSITHNERPNGFTIALKLSLRFNASIIVPDLQLTLASVHGDDPGELILKSSEPFRLDGSITTILLTTQTTTNGWYDLNQLTMKIGSMLLTHDFQVVNMANADVVKISILEKPFPVMVYPHQDELAIKARQSPVVDLSQPGKIQFEFRNGTENIDKCVFWIRPATSGVRLDLEAAQFLESETTNDFEIEFHDDYPTLILSNLKSHHRIAFVVPYSIEAVSQIDIKVEMICHQDEKQHSVFHQTSVPTVLPISVNVQDIFQAGRLFSRFTAVPSTSVPLQILKYAADEDAGFEIKKSNMTYEPVDVFNKLPASWMIEAIPRDSDTSKLPLTVHYQSFADLVLNTVESSFLGQIKGSPASFASRLLVPHLLAQVSSLWTEQDLETAVLLREFEIHSFETVNWDNTLRALDRVSRSGVETWLRSWHTRNKHLSLVADEGSVLQVKLLVDMPRPLVIVSTDVRVQTNKRQHIVVGEPISAQIDITYASNTDLDFEVGFEISSQPDTWLLGGKKRGTLPHKTENGTASLILIPQRTGHLLLPSVDVRCYAAGDHGEMTSLNIEVENKSQAKTMLVVPGLKSTTIAVGVESVSGRHLVVESRRR